ncbi:hypothetical protein [Phytohabitans houttuyneae]|uniref:Uncharacterized protein n=1 Tax=Phytohabitans houttuyneae TaxID=1076126 RepID=A0A6V8KJ60_9ACTN|nr:hypothetical protein [Phytohabitans houttuyneae]GFJ82016.1 hypothetical protein Phou_061960 [Phytohabitans houttuyneae]
MRAGELGRVRRARFMWVGGGALATVLALDALGLIAFLAWSTTWRRGDPACESVVIGDCLTFGDIAGWVVGSAAVLLVFGLPVSVAFIVAALSILNGVTKWTPGNGSGTAVALTLGVVCAIAGPALVGGLLASLVALAVLR